MTHEGEEEGDLIEFDEEQEHEWDNYLREFRSDVYPTFEKHGISLDAALIVWFVNKVRNAIPDVA